VRFLLVLLLSAFAAAWFVSKRDEVVEVAEALAKERAKETVTAAREDSDAAAPVTSSGEVVIRAAQDGHFYLVAKVNGTPVQFLVDTGASSVVLSADAARRARILPNRMEYTGLASTANGTVRMALVTLRELRVGEHRMRDVQGSVNEADMPLSLLGMSFLNRLESFEFADDRLILHW
jgi:aspartyl protease family protein